MACWTLCLLVGLLYPLLRLYLDPPLELPLPPQALSQHRLAFNSSLLKGHVSLLFSNLEALLVSARPKSQKSMSKYNFASLNGGSKIIERSLDLRNPNNLLADNGDQYMYTECTQKDKYLVVRLSEDILVDSFDVSSQEYYSNNIKVIRISGCINYPCAHWTPLGTYRAANLRHQPQAFRLETQVWTRFMKVELLSFYESDHHYCVITQFRVYGTTMLVDLHNQFSQKPPQHTTPINTTQSFSRIQPSFHPFSNFTYSTSTPTKKKKKEKKKDKVCSNYGTQVVLQPPSQGLRWEDDYQVYQNCMNQAHLLHKMFTHPLRWKITPTQLPPQEKSKEPFELSFVSPEQDYRQQSIFTRLVHHIRRLEDNQQVLQSFVREQTQVNDQQSRHIEQLIANHRQQQDYLTTLAQVLTQKEQEGQAYHQALLDKLATAQSLLEAHRAEQLLQNQVFSQGHSQHHASCQQTQAQLSRLQAQSGELRPVDYLFLGLFLVVIGYKLIRINISRQQGKTMSRPSQSQLDLLSENNQKDENRMVTLQRPTRKVKMLKKSNRKKVVYIYGNKAMPSVSGFEGRPEGSLLKKYRTCNEI